MAHELKNPLTSLRSAVETLPLARNDSSRARLMEVIQHDVKRLDRLISDISDASRLDAELQRQEAVAVDLKQLLEMVVGMAQDVRRDDGVRVSLAFERGAGAAASFVVPGHASRLGQVVDNLVSNARSFSPKGGEVRVTCRGLKDEVEIVVDDDGPGIQPDALARIFERFYTDRPHQGFGQNSGLGLSISRQIVEAHGGRIWAENRTATGPDGIERVVGARFIVRLPAGVRPAMGEPSIHASCVAIGGRGVLIRGASGAGKSTLALRLILDAPRVLAPAELVADDRVLLRVEAGALVARPVPALAGLVEARGLAASTAPLSRQGVAGRGGGSRRAGRHPSAAGTGANRSHLWLRAAAHRARAP